MFIWSKIKAKVLRTPAPEPEPTPTGPIPCTIEGPGYAIFYGTAYCTLRTPEGEHILRIRNGVDNTLELDHGDMQVSPHAAFADYMDAAQKWIAGEAESAEARAVNREYDTGNDRRAAIREQKARKADS
jgi:hypothetical protein